VLGDAFGTLTLAPLSAVNLLRGLTASLGVQQSYLQVMTPYARLALRRLQHLEAPQQVQGADALNIAPLLGAALASGEALGVQVSVRRNGVPLVELAAGAADPYESLPVGADTLFCCFSVTKAVASAAVHLLAARGSLDLDQRVSFYWPAFGSAGKEDIRVCDVLAHRAGLQNAGTHEMAADPLVACDSERMMALIAACAPDPATLGVTTYHYLSYGWILDGLVRGATGGVSLRHFARTEFALPLGCQDEFGIGLPPGSSAPRSTLVLRRKEDLAAARPSAAAAPGVATAKEGRRPPSAPSMLMNPTFFNKTEVANASLPSANGHFSARALTAFYDGVAAPRSSIFPGGLAARMLALRGSAAAEGNVAAGAERATLQGGGERSFLSGFVHYAADDADAITFGHSGLGGSTALCRVAPETGDCISVAITVNRLAADSALTRRVVRHAFIALSLPVPSAFE
jgi:aarF domain-containing kinase